MTIQDSLRQLGVLSHFSLKQFELLAGAAELLTLPPDDLLVEHGQTGDHIYGLKSGTLTVQRNTTHGEFVLARLKPGEIIGETNYIDQHVRSTDVMTASEAEVIKLDADRLHEISAENQQFELALYWMLWKSASRKLRITTSMLSHYIATPDLDDGPTTVGQPRERGEVISIDVHDKRDLFLEQGLSHMEANFLASLSEAQRFADGDTIFREGEAGDKLYFILDGAVRISKEIQGTGEEALAILDRGEFFGEMALVDARPRTADAVAHDQGVELLVVPASVVSGLLDIDKLSSPRLLKMVCRTVAERLRTLNDKIIAWYVISGGQTTMLGPPPSNAPPSLF